MSRRWIRLVTVLFLGYALLGPALLRSHEFALESVMNAFVKIEPREAHVVIRLPLHLLKTVNLPLTGRELDLANAEPAIQRALEALGRDITLSEDGRRLAPSSAIGRLSLPSDRSFDQYEEAVSHVARPVDPGTSIYADQGYFDAHLTYPITSSGSVFAIRTAVAPELKDYLKFAIRYLPPAVEARAMVITSRSGTVALNPTWYTAAVSFVALGVAPILSGVDHLLFLLCLVIPLRGWRQILAIITTFPVAQSITLLGSAYGLAPAGVWFPPFVETAIAASIVYMALENIISVDVGRRVLITGLFGLVHGFGFSYGLQEKLQFAGSHLVGSLLAFNIGIEIGQILVLAVMLPALAVARRYLLPGRVGMIILSAIVAHSGWHWMTDRGDVLLKLQWPRPSAAGLAILAFWIAGILLAARSISVIARRLRFTSEPGLPSLQKGLVD